MIFSYLPHVLNRENGWTNLFPSCLKSIRADIIYLHCAGLYCGPHERRLINDLMSNYKTLERPVANESDAVVLKFGLTLQQIMDVVSGSLHSTVAH